MQENLTAVIESLDHEGRGVTHVEGKTIFIEGALPYETVSYKSYRKKNSFEQADVTEIHKASFMRAEPRCPHFGVCGGCSMQHLEFSAQVAVKQRVLEDNLQRIGKVRAGQILTPISGQAWGYRRRGRMSARYVAKKDAVLIGFHERKSSFIADMKECHILPPHISALLLPLRKLVGALSIKQRMPQIEYAGGADVDVLVFRNMDAITSADEVLFEKFAQDYSSVDRPIQIWLQPKGPETCFPLTPKDAPALTYRLENFNIEMPYYPGEFTQVNPEINNVMVSRALKLLDPQAGERIADMFCGIGNFTLPIARSGAQVHGLEGSDALVKRAIENAKHNNLEHIVSYEMANLFEVTADSLAKLGYFDKMLIDPPRDGAMQLCRAFNDENAPKRLVYVSCNPATLARDAGILVNTKGYTLKSAGIINMFPHTAHVESIAWFEKTAPCLSQAELDAIEAEEARIRDAQKALRDAKEAERLALDAEEKELRRQKKQGRIDFYFAEKARREALGMNEQNITETDGHKE